MEEKKEEYLGERKIKFENGKGRGNMERRTRPANFLGVFRMLRYTLFRAL